MISELFDSIADRLNEIKTDIPIYIDEIPQGFQQPSFFIKLIKSVEHQELGNRYQIDYAFDIMYYPTDEVVNTLELHEMAWELYFNLEFLPFNGGKILAFNMENTIDDDVLHFFVTYKLRVKRKLEEKDKMLTYTQTINMRGT